MANKINIKLCPSPDLFDVYNDDGKNTLVIVVDIFRATSVITTALANGAMSVIPVMSCNECEELGERHGYLMAAERNVSKCDFAHLGNSPKEYTRNVVENKNIVFTTTNGTKALTLAKDAGFGNIIVGSFLNVGAIAKYISDNNYMEILIVASGWNGKVCVEDCLFSGCLTSVLHGIGFECCLNDMALMMSLLYKEETLKDRTLLSFIRNTEHYKRLEMHNLTSDAEYCLQRDLYDFVVVLDDTGLLRKYVL